MILTLKAPNCDGISKGMVFACYSDMCRTLGVDPARGNSLAAQKKLFSRYFSYERRNGRKCVITDVYDEPLPEKLVENGGRGRYAKYVEPVLFDFVTKCLNSPAFDDSECNGGCYELPDGQGAALYGSADGYAETYGQDADLLKNLESICPEDKTYGMDGVNKTEKIGEDPRDFDNSDVCADFGKIREQHDASNRMPCLRIISDDGDSSCRSGLFAKTDLLAAVGFVNLDYARKSSILRERSDIVLFSPCNSRPDKSCIKADGRLVISTDDVAFFEDICGLIYEKWRSVVKAVNNHGVLFCEPAYLVSTSNGSAPASGVEVPLILQAENNVIEDACSKEMRQTFIKRRYKAFYVRRNAKMGELVRSPDISVYNCLKITLKSGAAKNRIFPDFLTVNEMRHMINSMVVSDIYKKIHKCKKDFDSGWNNGKLGETQINVLKQPNFCEIQERLVDIFVRI